MKKRNKKKKIKIISTYSIMFMKNVMENMLINERKLRLTISINIDDFIDLAKK